MKIISNKKGFKIIAIDRITLANKLGSPGVCDTCNMPTGLGYWVVVLNCWLCPHCFQDWYDNATNYPEDRKIEKQNFERMKQILGL